jgi:protease-4
MTMRLKFSFLAILLSLLFLNGCAIVTIPLLPTTEEFHERVVEGEGKDKILLLDISGVISEEKRRRMGFREEVSVIDELKETLKKAEKDKNLKGIILRINSPGGTVTASDIIHHELLAYKKRTGQRIMACLMDVGASGAYYVATAADEIVSHPTTITGSIGVVTMKFNVQGLMSKIGVEQETIKSGDKKDIMSPFRPSTPEEQKIMQTIINTLYGRFVDVIVDGRKPLTREAIEKLADGRIYTADQALSAGLIDRIGYLDSTIEGMKKTLGLEKASIIVYSRPDSYKSTIYSGLTPAPPQVNLISINGQELLASPGVRFMYLWLP